MSSESISVLLVFFCIMQQCTSFAVNINFSKRPKDLVTNRKFLTASTTSWSVSQGYCKARNIQSDTKGDHDSNEKWFQQAIIMAGCGAILGPFLDGYHSAFGVLKYSQPIFFDIGGVNILQTDIWVPPLFGLAGAILGLSYPVLDKLFGTSKDFRDPSIPSVLYCIAFFSFQYYLSGLISYSNIEPKYVNLILAPLALGNWFVFDRTKTGFIMSTITGLAGPAVEISLLNFMPYFLGHSLYHYEHPDFLGIPVWITWVYFCGAPAVGNLGRMFWSRLL